MILTILEGHVSTERSKPLEMAYRTCIKKMPVQLRQTFLVRDQHDKTLWQIVSIWRSAEDYQHVIDHDLHTCCENVFRSVGVQPTRRVFNIQSQHQHV